MKSVVISLITTLITFNASAQQANQSVKIPDDIEIIKLSDNAYIHVSVTEIPGFGQVSSNGMLLVRGDKAFMVDTPATEEQTRRLTEWVSDSLSAKVTMFAPGHWHNDCIAGLDYLHGMGVESVANQMTIDITAKKGLSQPKHGFEDYWSVCWQGMEIFCYYLGAGHSLDNIVVWVPSEKILFGGCLIKGMEATNLGNTADGDIEAWPHTLSKVLRRFDNSCTVIPGHGQAGGMELVRHSLELLSPQK